MADKICPVCGGKFISDYRQKRKKYCSLECRNKAYLKSGNPKVYHSCDWCGELLPPNSTEKYCSEDCKRRAKGYQEPKKRGRKKKVLSLDEIAKLSKAEGLHYGDYVNKYGV